MMEQELKRRVIFYETTFISYKKMLEEFHKNCKNVIKEEWEWYREILVEGRNESKNQLAHAVDELRNFREGLNPLFLYKHR
jgi:hypothetical protein